MEVQEVQDKGQKSNSFAKKTGVVVGVLSLSPLAMAADPIGIADAEAVATQITAASAPIATIAGASLGVYVGLRVWKMVRRAI